jgi:hypothetical protein
MADTDHLYHVGNTGSKIYITVHVSTPGIAQSRIEFINDNPTDLPGSQCDASGNINYCLVDVNTNLNGKNLGIGTSINLQTVDSSLWPTMYASLVVTYTISGGSDGTKQFTYASSDKSKDASGQFIKVNKAINLIA